MCVSRRILTKPSLFRRRSPNTLTTKQIIAARRRRKGISTLVATTMSASSQLMDKQITGLSSSQSADIFDLLSRPRPDAKSSDDDPFDFKPARYASSFSDLDARPWNSADSRTNIRNYGAVEPHDLTVSSEKSKDAPGVDILMEIDKSMNKHTENLMHTLEGVSARLSQMETRTRHLENSVDDLKVTVGNNHGSTDGKLRHLENILREVQNGIQMLRDKQEITEAQLHLSKLQASKTADQAAETPLAKQTDSVPQPIQPPAVIFPPHNLTPPNAPPQPVQQSLPQIGNMPAQLTTNQLPSGQVIPRESYYTPPPQNSETSNPQYQIPAQQPQPYLGVPPHAPYSQPSQITQQHPPALGSVNVNPPTQQLQSQVNFHPEENPYMSSNPPTYPPNMRPSVGPPPSQTGSPSSSQFFGPNSNMYESSGNRSSNMFEPSGNRSGSGNFSYPSGYNPPASGSSGSNPHAFSGSPSHYGGPLTKHPGYSSPSAPIGGSGHPRIPTAQLLPQALPTAKCVGSNPPTGAGRVPVDDVVDKVTTMGFSRDQVRTTVRKLTENGQTVDLNVVLDKLMNDGRW